MAETKQKTEAEIKYSDIIDLPHHVSSKRHHMSMTDRGAQFSPFAALTGFEDKIEKEAGDSAKRQQELDSTFETMGDA